MIIDEGISKCNATDSQSYKYGTWQLSSDGTKLTTSSIPGNNIVTDINNLDDTILITSKKSISSGDTSVMETKYIH